MLYSTDMVVSILEDRKKKTRRMKGLEMINEFPDLFDLVQVHYRFGEEHPEVLYATFSGDRLPDDKFGYLCEKYNYAQPTIKCPYGKPGDILWVRETWAPATYWNGLREECHAIFKTQFTAPVAWNWKPSIHMPKVAARIWLQITDIKVERLQQITEEEALSEGIIECEDGTYYNYFTQKGLRYQDGVECLLAKGSFQSLWCSINGLDSWAQNPWVWVISFKILSKTGRPDDQVTKEKEVAHA